jgi:hypothetical protein
MESTDLYEGISSKKQAEYETWLIATYGGELEERVDLGRKKYPAMSEAEKQLTQDELIAVETAWVEAMKNGVPTDSKALEPLLKRHRTWVSAMWNRPCLPDAYAGLADMLQSHPDFVSRYEAIAPGFSNYHAASMKSYAKLLVA